MSAHSNQGASTQWPAHVFAPVKVCTWWLVGAASSGGGGGGGGKITTAASTSICFSGGMYIVVGRCS